jgi:hypothetical protein
LLRPFGVSSQLWNLDNKSEHSMAIGIVKFFNTQKGYGFIGPSDGSRDESGMSNLREGQRVTYEVVTE